MISDRLAAPGALRPSGLGGLGLASIVGFFYYGILEVSP
jgi:hypothetical protein